MNKIIVLLTVLILASCGSVSVTKNADGSYEASSMSLFKDIKDVSIHKDVTGEVNASLGESAVNQDAQSALFLVCALNPAMPMCQMDQ